MSCCGGSSVPNDKFSTFADACYIGNVEKMKELMKKDGKNPSQLVNQVSKDGMLPIHRACQGQKGSVECIKYLVENGADVRRPNANGETALHLACFHKNVPAVKELLKTAAKEDVNVQEKKHGMTPLHIAVYKGNSEITKLLIDAGADPMIQDKTNQDVRAMAEFWVEQQAAGLSSPNADHKETYAILSHAIRA